MARFFLLQENIRDGRGFVGGQELEHLRKVLRLGIGDRVTLFDDSGWEHDGVIAELAPAQATVRIENSYRPGRDAALKTTLATGLTKGEKFEFIVEKATELGVHTLVGFSSARSVPQLDERRVAKRLERWHKIALSATKQCGRTQMPTILSVVQLDDILRHAPAHALKIFFWERETGRSLRQLHAQQPSVEELYLIVGPEGGFTDREADAARDRGFHLATMGRRILRAETAAIAVATLAQYLWGDLG